MSKEQNQKNLDKMIVRSSKLSALDYHSSLERLLADISIKLTIAAEYSIVLESN